MERVGKEIRMILSLDIDKEQFQTNTRNLEEPKAQTRGGKRGALEKGWKRLSWMLAIFAFVASAMTFLRHHPVRELSFCFIISAVVFALVRLGLHMVKGFYEKLPHNHS
jgi:hypothetical protein